MKSLKPGQDHLPFRQPLRTLAFDLPPVGSVDVDRLDGMLKQVFAVEVWDSNLPSCADELREEFRLYTWVSRATLLARTLWIASGVPVFDRGRIVSLERATGGHGHRVVLAVPSIEFVPVELYRFVYQRSIAIIRSFIDDRIASLEVENVRDMVNEKIVRTVRTHLQAGKSTVQVLTCAHAMGIPFIHLGRGLYQLGWGALSRKLDRSSTDGDRLMGARLVTDKLVATQVLRAAGLPAPDNCLSQSVEQGLAAIDTLGRPVVVKPVDGERGEGITLGVEDESALRVAIATAKKFSPSGRALVERNIAGVCHRVFIVRDRLLYAVKRWPKSVMGDGALTVEGLVRRANQDELSLPPWLRSEPYPLDELADKTLLDVGLDRASVPEVGRLVHLRPIESTRWGGFDEEVTAKIHPDNVALAIRAAQLFGLEVAGVDIICEDISVSWRQSRAVINEVNYAPLLGGGEISRRYVQEFLSRVMMGGTGRIPVHLVTTDRADVAVDAGYMDRLIAQYPGCHITSATRTFDDGGCEIPMAIDGLAGRCVALLLNGTVGGIVLLAGAGDTFTAEFPVDRFEGQALRDKTPW